VGLFHRDTLLAFAWGCHHGDHAHYDAAASTRHTDLKLPLGYALAGDLIRWSKQNGATWFDFGGVTTGSRTCGDADPVGGISDFKRYFSKNIIEVGDEWVLEPRSIRAALARIIGKFAAHFPLSRYSGRG